MKYRPVPLNFRRLPPATQRQRAEEFTAWMRTRRTVRHFSPDPVPLEIIVPSEALGQGCTRVSCQEHARAVS